MRSLLTLRRVCVLWASCLWLTPALAQGRLPVAVMPETNWQPAGYLQSEMQNHLLEGTEVLSPSPGADGNEQFWPDGSPVAPAELPEVPEESGLPAYLQFRHDLAITWNAGSGDTLGIVDFDYRAIPSAKPKGSFAVGLSPGFGAHVLNGPQSTDLPGTLYDVSIDVQGMWVWNPKWTLYFGVSPSLYTDFHNTSSEAFRLPARILAFWNYSETLQLAFGAVYFDRQDVSWLPAAGLIYTPNERAKLELLFPKPRILRRVHASEDREGWVYLGGEFAGGSYAIERSSGLDDIATYSALRLLVGYERKRLRGGPVQRFEAGYVFNRTLRYASGIGDYDLGGTAMLRVGVGF